MSAAVYDLGAWLSLPGATTLELLMRLLLAVALGGLIGYERERSDKPAGFRTNILICLGAALHRDVCPPSCNRCGPRWGRGSDEDSGTDREWYGVPGCGYDHPGPRKCPGPDDRCNPLVGRSDRDGRRWWRLRPRHRCDLHRHSDPRRLRADRETRHEQEFREARTDHLRAAP